LHYPTAIVKEILTHKKRKHWKVIPIEERQSNIKILDSVWSLRKKGKLEKIANTRPA